MGWHLDGGVLAADIKKGTCRCTRVCRNCRVPPVISLHCFKPARPAHASPFHFPPSRGSRCPRPSIFFFASSSSASFPPFQSNPNTQLQEVVVESSALLGFPLPGVLAHPSIRPPVAALRCVAHQHQPSVIHPKVAFAALVNPYSVIIHPSIKSINQSTLIIAKRT